MKAGDFDRRVALYSRTVSQDGNGQAIEAFALVDTVWGQRVYPRIAGQEVFAGQQVNSQAFALIRIRYRSDIATIWRVVAEGITYNVVSVAEIGRKSGIELRCEQVIPHG